MKVKSANFIKSCADPNEASGGAFSPQICVAGRSNCGKSSLLNLLMGAKLCKTSSTPGRTRLINVFEVKVASDKPTVPDKFFFVDLPGYGFAAAAKSDADEWNTRTDSYFSSASKDIAQALCLMDIRRDPSDLDKTLINYFRDMGVPFTVVLTKADKLSRAQAGNAKIKIASSLGLARDNLIVTSSLDKIGREQVLERLEAVISSYCE
ncbi:MAG: ribosome biogenesis GTP-binding protein YsxC [Clostridiales bacterium]|nr:ribosome biogenesis GTP-binding protein YsxC [Clostridiales bacterium]